MRKKNRILFAKARGEIVVFRVVASSDLSQVLSAPTHPNKWQKDLEVYQKTLLSRIN